MASAHSPTSRTAKASWYPATETPSRHSNRLAAEIADQFKAETGILDGEIVCLDAKGYPQFEDLMFRRGELFFVAFDALYLDGEDLRGLPLIDRKARLKAVLPFTSE